MLIESAVNRAKMGAEDEWTTVIAAIVVKCLPRWKEQYL
jgi:hypothetical protein